MTITISAAGSAHLEHRTKRLATLWRLERRDERVLTFTNHDKNIFFDAGLNSPGFFKPDVRVYTPVGGFDSTAKRRELGLKEQNLSFRGIVSSEEITIDDLRGGLYRGARLNEFVVDWQFPFRGAIIQNEFTIQETTFNGEFWSASVAGVAHKFATKTGESFSKFCPFEVFEFGGVRNCRKNIEGYTRDNCITAGIQKDRRVFRATENSCPDDHGIKGVALGNDAPFLSSIFVPGGLGVDNPEGIGFFGAGKVTWLTGFNKGLVSEVRSFIFATREFTLYLPTPFDIQPGDSFAAQAGCIKDKTICIEKFANLPNFGGFSFLVGPKEAIKTIDTGSTT